MGKILAFAGSNSSTSINFQLVKKTVEGISGHSVGLLEMHNFDIPIYSEDLEKQDGFPEKLLELKDKIRAADGLVISVNEHNGNPSAFFKNILDWLSRTERKFLEDRSIFLMSTSGGKRGAQSSCEQVSQMLQRFGAIITGPFSLPSYYENFDPEKGITDASLNQKHKEYLQSFLSGL
ncbi:NADPH-dependent FMN reductase [Robiginitalea sp. IMCC44478]|uniref:NADPH-dependent FMN reductase n=1 Tax=Robiginitalea sp. IMCC44478 TaxID=3459122 RepID=UPI0040430196